MSRIGGITYTWTTTLLHQQAKSGREKTSLNTISSLNIYLSRNFKILILSRNRSFGKDIYLCFPNVYLYGCACTWKCIEWVAPIKDSTLTQLNPQDSTPTAFHPRLSTLHADETLFSKFYCIIHSIFSKMITWTEFS